MMSILRLEKFKSKREEHITHYMDHVTHVDVPWLSHMGLRYVEPWQATGIFTVIPKLLFIKY